MDAKNTNKQIYKKFEGTGQFPTDSHGKIINNRTTGFDPKQYSFEIYKKTVKEKIDLSIAKSKHKQALKLSHGNNWRKFINP